MARAGVLYSHVVAVALQLLNEGKNPTVDLVRAGLGGTGSNSTIAPMLKRWKEEQAVTMPDTALGLPAPLVQAIRQVYESLRNDAMAELERVTLVHDDALESAQAEMKQAHAQVSVLVGEKSTMAAELAQALEQMAQLRSALQRQDQLLAGVRIENTGLLQRLDDRTTEVATVNQQLTHARTQFEHYQASNAAQRTEERRSFERRIAQQDHELAELRQQVELKQVASAQLAGQMTRVIEENQRLERDSQSAHLELGQLRANRDRTTSEAAQIADERVQLMRKHEALQLELNAAHTAMAVGAREMTLAGESLAGMERRVDALAQQKLDLLRQHAVLEADLRLCRTSLESVTEQRQQVAAPSDASGK